MEARAELAETVGGRMFHRVGCGPIRNPYTYLGVYV